MHVQSTITFRLFSLARCRRNEWTEPCVCVCVAYGMRRIMKLFFHYSRHIKEVFSLSLSSWISWLNCTSDTMLVWISRWNSAMLYLFMYVHSLWLLQCMLSLSRMPSNYNSHEVSFGWLWLKCISHKLSLSPCSLPSLLSLYKQIKRCGHKNYCNKNRISYRCTF